MRQRKIKNVEDKLLNCQSHLAELDDTCRGNWKQRFGNDNPIYLELGCGKGKFLMQHAAEFPFRNYIGIEGQDSVVLRALEKAVEAGQPNIRFSGKFVKDLREFFAEGELSGIYLNFSDPWPKTGHAKRRLTYRGYLEQYREVLKPGGFVQVKTDNDGLFQFTLEEAEDSGIFRVLESSWDLYSTEFEAREISTEYENKFREQGLKIKYAKLG